MHDARGQRCACLPGVLGCAAVMTSSTSHEHAHDWFLLCIAVSASPAVLCCSGAGSTTVPVAGASIVLLVSGCAAHMTSQSHTLSHHTGIVVVAVLSLALTCPASVPVGVHAAAPSTLEARRRAARTSGACGSCCDNAPLVLRLRRTAHITQQHSWGQGRTAPAVRVG